MQRKNRIALAIGLALLAVAFLVVKRQRDAKSPQVEIAGMTMGTTYSVRYVPEPPIVADAAFRADVEARIDATLERVDDQMSTWRPDSEISRFNALATSASFAVSSATVEVFDLARQISELSGGAFDVTVGPLVDAYGFGSGSEGLEPPDAAELSALRERVGCRMLTIDTSARTLAKQRPDIHCDLDAIAPGYGVDQVAEALDAAGLVRYLVEIGGEVRVRGLNASGKPWQIGIERPSDYERTLQSVIGLRDMSVSTSGDYRNFYVRDGKRLSHTIDPRTGRPVEHALASVSVLDKRCARADALATALMVLGPDEGFAFAEREGIAALFLVRQSEEKFTEKHTRDFPVLVDE